MYSVPQSEQLSIFLSALGVGFLLGILYDLFRAIRLSFSSSRIATVIFDLLYFFFFGLISFLFILALNKGEIRSYIIIGELIGALFYYVSFGIAAIKFTNILIRYLKRFYAFVYKVISAPFRLIKCLLNSLFKKTDRLLRKTEKISKKMRKKHFPKLQMYVYNLFGIFLASSTRFKKGGIKNGKEKEQKEA